MENNRIDFNGLSSVDFENFCYDLLIELGYTKVSWRKGTGEDASPSDQGRDIEAELIKSEVDDSKTIEKYLIECKHYIKGVPSTKIDSILNRGWSERPNVVLIIVSNFLANSTKDYIETYKERNKPPFKIVCWEKPTLERLVSTRSKLIRKYNLLGVIPHLLLIHPAHAQYLKHTKPNKLDYFFTLMDELDKTDMEPYLNHVERAVIKPRMRKPIKKGETLNDLVVDKVSYSVFKTKCYELSEFVSQSFLVSAIVNYILQGIFRTADHFTLDESVAHSQSFINTANDYSIKSEFIDEDTRDSMRKMYQKFIDEAPDNTRKAYKVYQRFCDNVVSKLIDEELDLPSLEEMEKTLKALDKLPER